MYLTRCLFRKTKMGGEVIPPTPNVSKVVPKLKIGVRHERRRFSNPEGPLGRLKKMRKTVTALIKYERIELNSLRGLEARGYAERLIVEAIRNGDHHKPTMELADFWLEEKQLIHKLFKVLVPRYSTFTTNFTRCYGAPSIYPDPHKRCIMELKGHPFPPVIVDSIPRRNLLHNILLDEARNEFRRNKEILAGASITQESVVGGSPTAEESNKALSEGIASIPDKDMSSSDSDSTDGEHSDLSERLENINLKSESGSDSKNKKP